MVYFEKKFLAIGVLFFVSLAQWIRVSPLLPSVMQDEYVYLSQALFTPLAEDQFGNPLYSFVLSPLSAYPDHFYLIAKLLNAIFLFGFLLVIYFISIELIDKKLALLVSVALGFGAISLYSSLFMPEMMFYFLASLTLFFAYKALSDEDRAFVWSTGALLSITLTGLVKPHAFILWSGLVIVFVLISVKDKYKRSKMLGISALLLVGYPALKLSGGFLLAGQAGLTLLGPNYEESLIRFIERIGLVNSESLSASAISGVSVAENGIGLSSVIASGFVSLLTLLVGLFLATAGAMWSYLLRPRAMSDFQILVGVVTIVYLLATAAFSALVTLSGDDHSDRILLRYLEFLVPFILLASLVEVSKRERINNGPVVSTIVVSIIALAGWLFVGSLFDLQIVDSASLTGLSYFWILGVLPSAAAVLTVFIAKNRSMNSTALVAGIFSALIALTGFSAFSGFHQINAFSGPADAAGHKLRSDYPDVAGEKILVIGADRRLAFVVKFWSFRPEVEHEVAGFNDEIDLNQSQYSGYELIIQIPGPAVSGGEVIDGGENYRIITP